MDDGRFVLGTAYTTGIGSVSVMLATGHFNNDTRLDIAVINCDADNIVVFLGSASETLADVQRQLDIVIACFDTDHIETLVRLC